MSLERAKKVLTIEAEAILSLVDHLDHNFTAALDLIVNAPGKVIVIGIGKSGLIGRKIAATLASTGTPAFFVHPSEGVHGDIGMISKGDVALMISKSGETEELLSLLPAVKRLGIPVIGLLGKPDSRLGREADAVLDVGVPEEACPLQLAPTASTTAALAMGDALALSLLERRGFGAEDFARLHPSGSLGKKLLLRVCDVMHKGDDLPVVAPDAGFKEIIYVMSSKMLGHAAVVAGDELVGVISDGDLRRAMEKCEDITRLAASQIMTPSPKFAPPEELAAAALRRMEKHSITALLVCDDPAGKRLVGLIHLHALLKAGVV